MTPARGAADRVAPVESAGDTLRTDSLADSAAERNYPPVGRCISCGQHIRMTIPSTCATCRAWHRWYSARRIASRYLREAMR